MAHIKLTVDGVAKSVREWANHTGTNIETIRTRRNMGWSDRECVYGRPRKNARTIISKEGVSKNPQEWSKLLNIPIKILYARMPTGNVLNDTNGRILRPYPDPYPRANAQKVS